MTRRKAGSTRAKRTTTRSVPVKPPVVARRQAPDPLANLYTDLDQERDGEIVVGLGKDFQHATSSRYIPRQVKTIVGATVGSLMAAAAIAEGGNRIAARYGDPNSAIYKVSNSAIDKTKSMYNMASDTAFGQFVAENMRNGYDGFMYYMPDFSKYDRRMDVDTEPVAPNLDAGSWQPLVDTPNNAALFPAQAGTWPKPPPIQDTKPTIDPAAIKMMDLKIQSGQMGNAAVKKQTPAMIVSDGIASVVASKQARGADAAAIAMDTPVIDPFQYKMGQAGQISSDADAISQRLISESGADLGQSMAEALDGQTPDEAAVERVAAQTVQAIEKQSDHAAPMIDAVAGVTHVPAVQTSLQQDSTPAGALAQRQQSDAPALTQQVGAVVPSLVQLKVGAAGPGPGGKMGKSKKTSQADVDKDAKLKAYFASKKTLEGAQSDLAEAVAENRPAPQIQTLQNEVEAANKEVLRFEDMLLPRGETPQKHLTKAMKSQSAYTATDQSKADARAKRIDKQTKAKKTSKAKQQLNRADALDQADADEQRVQASRPRRQKVKKHERNKKTADKKRIIAATGPGGKIGKTKKKSQTKVDKKVTKPMDVDKQPPRRKKKTVASELSDYDKGAGKQISRAIRSTKAYASTDEDRRDARKKKTQKVRKDDRHKKRSLWRKVDLSA